MEHVEPKQENNRPKREHKQKLKQRFLLYIAVLSGKGSIDRKEQE